MNPNSNETLENLAVSSLAQCLLRISRVSPGTWRVLGVKVSAGTVTDAVKQHDFKNSAAAVYFNLPDASPLAAIMLFDPKDMVCISKCFTGHSFPRGPAITPADEVMLTELGNIVLNALMNGFLNALKKCVLPAVPQMVEGDMRRLTGELGKIVNPNQGFRIITAALALQCDDSVAMSEVMALLPEKIALELELLQPPA
ncbi:MAG: hypothetical protein A2270_04250 [Elusimicrobia bacterium RIFOXYA12_FULL_51_18]|nr:MAG: hypothetical protein A2270_04250 [Elusimicrobia bacterium RIFOXYA12_FULL_51_18]OGS30071.1 MAG: hypothetical protein A2218_13075 [Elusimicrobia bacterium RIFOXYA2_FULL_53_38]